MPPVHSVTKVYIEWRSAEDENITIEAPFGAKPYLWRAVRGTGGEGSGGERRPWCRRRSV